MAPFEHQQRSSVDANQQHEDPRDELVIEARLDHRDLEAGNKIRNRDDSDDLEDDDSDSDAGGFSDYEGRIPDSGVPRTVTVTTTTSVSHLGPHLTRQPSSSTSFISVTTTISSRPTGNPLAGWYWSQISTSQGRKGLNPAIQDYPTSLPTLNATPSNSAATTTSTGPISTPALGDAGSESSSPDDGSRLSPTAQHVLISAASIGVFIAVAAMIYLTMRFTNVDVLWLRKFTSRGRGSRRPPPYGHKDFDIPPYPTLNDEKPAAATRKLYTPIIIPNLPVVAPPSAQALSRAEYERQKMRQEALLSNCVPVAAREALLSNCVPLAAIPTNAPKKSSYSSSTPRTPRQSSVKHGRERPVSELSSLSSGFGDAKIDIPESGPTKQEAHRKSVASRSSRNNLLSRFSHSSWISMSQTPSRSKDRDTIYTTTSVDSTPRFRTVNSWVSQQAGRIQRQREHDREVENMPEMPAPLAKQAKHQRLKSEAMDPAFTYHPGDEVPIAKGKRVPSAILDRII